MTHADAQLRAAADDGHRFFFVLLAIAGATAVSSLVLVWAERRVQPGRNVRRAWGGVLVAAPLAALLAVFAVYGGPVGIVDRAIESFQGPPPRVVDLSDRLRSFSGNGRDQLWSVAWGEFTERPVIGAGAGTYERAWLLERPADLPVRDAHSLYLETLSELGLVGLVALLAMLGVPAAAALRSRHTPLVPAAFGATAHTSSTPAPTGTGSWPASRSRRSSAARRSW